MIKRKFGQNFEVSALSLGAMGYGKSRDIPDRPEMIALLRKAVDLGMDFFDTAEVYGPWTNEEMVGEAFAGIRDKVKIATKFGWDIDQETGDHRGGVNSKPAQIRSAVEGSLKRLGTDYIDLYYQHRVDPHVAVIPGVGWSSHVGRGSSRRRDRASWPRPRSSPRAAGSGRGRTDRSHQARRRRRGRAGRHGVDVQQARLRGRSPVQGSREGPARQSAVCWCSLTSSNRCGRPWRRPASTMR